MNIHYVVLEGYEPTYNFDERLRAFMADAVWDGAFLYRSEGVDESSYTLMDGDTISKYIVSNDVYGLTTFGGEWNLYHHGRDERFALIKSSSVSGSFDCNPSDERPILEMDTNTFHRIACGLMERARQMFDERNKVFFLWDNRFLFYFENGSVLQMKRLLYTNKVAVRRAGNFPFISRGVAKINEVVFATPETD